MSNHPGTCIYCEKSEQEIPLIQFTYQGSQYWICPQHLPILIHEPGQLATKLPGIDQFSSVKNHS